MAVLSRMAHEIFTASETGEAVEKAKAQVDPESEDAAMLDVVARDYALRTKIPASLVAEQAKTAAQAHEIWVAARKANDFAAFAPILEKMVELARQTAEHLGYKEHIYDALTDLYEEGATKKGWEQMFGGMKEPLVALVSKISASPQVDDSFLYGDWPESSQRSFTEMLLKEIGFDLNRGRQDTAPHPFCTNFSIGDVRLTTRFKNYLPSAVMGTLHEAGHGMYEQGSPLSWDRTPLAGGVSLGVHESQSRTWENIVGRSKPFWSLYLPKLKETFPTLSPLDLETFYKGINKVEASLIRVEADEVTYNLHIMIRFELECAMMEGSLAIKDLPAAWNEKYREFLGIVPPTDSDGCLQDVHWSSGLMGYFPTYSMGNLLSYQIWNCLVADLGDVDSLMAKGEFKPILDWLIEKVYRHGRRYKPAELIHMATGKPLGPEDYLAGITDKYSAIYGLN